MVTPRRILFYQDKMLREVPEAKKSHRTLVVIRDEMLYMSDRFRLVEQMAQ